MGPGPERLESVLDSCHPTVAVRGEASRKLRTLSSSSKPFAVSIVSFRDVPLQGISGRTIRNVLAGSFPPAPNPEEMVQSPVTYEWACPICGITRISLTHSTISPVEDEEKNAISGHVRQTAGNGHGEKGELPSRFEDVEIADYVRFKERFGGRVAT